MNYIKKCFYLAIAIVVVMINVISCKNDSTNGPLYAQQPGFKQPVSQPLLFSKTKKIDWDHIPTVNVQPDIKGLDMSKLPVSSYSATNYKAFSKPVEEAQLDFNSLPGKDFDIDKLHSKSLKFKTFILPAPQLINAGGLHKKNIDLSLYELGEAQGLMGNGISCLYKDNDGFLWIAAFQGGLYRYDGENLLQYISAAADHPVNSILQDSSGLIWVSELGGGILVLDIKNGLLKRTNASRGMSSDNVLRMTLDKQQRIWVAYKTGGVDVINTKAQTIKFINEDEGLSTSAAARQVVQDQYNNIWIVTNGGGLNIIDPAGKKIKYLDKKHGLKSDSLSRILCDKGGLIWIGFDNGTINLLNPQKNSIQTIKEIQQPKMTLKYLYQDSKGEIWAGTNNGVIVLDPKKRMVRNIIPEDGLSGQSILRIEEDKDGQVWMGTNAGLNVVNNQKTVVEHIGKERTATVFEDSHGLIWQGTNNGVNIINRKAKTIKHLTKLQGLSNDTIQTIRQIKGDIFICNNSGLNIIDSALTSIATFGSEQGFTNKIIISIAADKEGRFWIGGDQDGMDVFDPMNSTLKHLGKARGLSDGFQIDDIKTDLQGHIWVSTRLGGVDEIDPHNWTIKYLNAVNGFKALLPDDKGNMWIGTANGIYIANIKNNTLTTLSRQQGLISESVLSLLQNKGHVYAGTNKGITEITPIRNGHGDDDKWEIKSFGEEYGIARINRGTYLTDMLTGDGLYCWGDNGLTLLRLPKNNNDIPSTRITGIDIMDEPKYFIDKLRYEVKEKDTLWAPGDVHYTSGQTPLNTNYALQSGLKWNGIKGPDNMPVSLQLPYDQNFVRFNFNDLNFTAHDTTWYRYKLSGVDQKWTEITNSTSSRNYFGLSPGKYTFEVTGRTADKAWSTPAKISFIITPPWWQTWWAYIIYVCMFAGSVWCFTYYRSRQLIKDKRMLEHKIHIRTEEVLQQKEEIEAQRDSLEKVIDELKVAQSQLVQSEKLASLGELTAGIAHEIQNPLNFVNNFSDVSMELIVEMKDELKSGNMAEAIALADDIELNLKKIIHHGKRADGIVKNMLMHSRSTSGERVATDINALADEYLRLAYHGLRAKDKTFNSAIITEPEDKLPRVSVVPQDLGRVMLNIFNNAFYAVHQKRKRSDDEYQPKVVFSTSSKKGAVEIRIKDNGIGIPENIKDKIMQPFFTTKPPGEGTGLGLSLTYDIIVKGYGGTININSKEGEFTEFIVTIPV